MTEKAKRTDWQVKEMSKPQQLKVDMNFTQDQFEKITLGLIPEEMEEKWFIFFENDWLYFHRSWTGFMTYKARITREEGEPEYSIKECWVERDAAIYSNESDSRDAVTLLMLIYSGLLKSKLPEELFRKFTQNDSSALNSWSTFGNMFFQ